MNIAGIVCEYNPMHKSHVYHIEKTREILGEDSGIVCVMSGNFVQRGDFAVMNKFARAKAAIKAGADLVLELPIPWSVSTAEKFAQGAVSIIDNIGVCTHLSFGSETGELDPLYDVARCLLDPEIDKLIRTELEKGISYAAARQKAVEWLLNGKNQDIKSPNNILAIEYIKALEIFGSNIEPLTIKRQGADHDDNDENELGVSASFLREKLLNEEDISEYVPEEVVDIISAEIKKGRCPISMDRCDTAIMAKLRSMTQEEYAALPDASEGLYARLRKAAFSEGSVKEVLEKVRTKRYAYARIRRMVICAYLGIKASDLDMLPPYARVLGMGKKGQKILSKMKKSSSIPIITKAAKVRDLSDECRYIFELGAKATDLYTLAYTEPKRRIGDTDYTTTPFVC